MEGAAKGIFDTGILPQTGFQITNDLAPRWMKSVINGENSEMGILIANILGYEDVDALISPDGGIATQMHAFGRYSAIFVSINENFEVGVEILNGQPAAPGESEGWLRVPEHYKCYIYEW